MMRESFNKDLIDWITTTLTLNEVFRSLSRKPVILFFSSPPQLMTYAFWCLLLPYAQGVDLFEDIIQFKEDVINGK